MDERVIEYLDEALRNERRLKDSLNEDEGYLKDMMDDEVLGIFRTILSGAQDTADSIKKNIEILRTEAMESEL